MLREYPQPIGVLMSHLPMVVTPSLMFKPVSLKESTGFARQLVGWSGLGGTTSAYSPPPQATRHIADTAVAVGRAVRH